MKARFRDSMTWLHTWAGVVAGGLLFVIFLTGTLAYFNNEITAWMRPEIRQIISPENALNNGQAYLSEHATNAKSWTILLPTKRFSPTTLYWRDPTVKGRGLKVVKLNELGEKITARDTRGGEFLYRFHFDLHYMPAFYARWLVGICAMFMLIAIISGVIIHKKIFKDFFTLQFNKGDKSWLNGHTITSVLALPFHLMITYTGLVTLMFMYLSWSMSLAMNDRNEYFNTIGQQPLVPSPTGITAKMKPFSHLYIDAKSHIGDSDFSYVVINNPSDENASIVFFEGATKHLLPDYLTLSYSAATGELLSEQVITNSAELTRRTMISLHSGRFATLPVRWLYFISGIMGSIMIATGLILWSEKRKKSSISKGSKIGNHLVDRLNIGVVIGLPIAIASFFVSNRLLPLMLIDRADIEIHCFFAGWIFTLLYSAVRGIKNSWRELSILAGGLFLTLPLLSVFTTHRHLLNYQIELDLTLLLIDLFFIIAGAIFIFIASQIKKYRNVKAMKLSARQGKRSYT
ncbi:MULTISPECIES: PepSY-associated TM helix domain-containing protein [Pseudoalteromonas]|uniref:PepSY-associated TM helix domain-containing protein n=1 Tax=Pseudoalteromonas TaxID=53246 RepID=UPI00186824B9|nr:MULTISPECIES: PepSY-associated TM helix domain-containing protein [Pseudoalteromonas]